VSGADPALDALLERPGPLDGVRVLDLTSVVMGPLATQILGDLGADVITVEGSAGDVNRTMDPAPRTGLSGVALNLMRNKRGVCIDLKDPAGRQAVLRIAAGCDVVVTNLRPRSLAGLGLTYEDVAAVRPDVVYCQAHGYPSDSARADDAAYDDVVQSAAGVADAARLATGVPGLTPTILADKVCGLTIVYSVVAALFHRQRTGQGQRVEVPMVDTVAAFMLVEHGAGAIHRPPRGPAGYRRVLAANRRPQRTSDGWVGVLPYTQRHWRDFCEQVGRPELFADRRVSSPAARVANADFVYGELAAIIATKKTAEWLELCRGLDIPVSEVATLAELVEALPEADHPVAGRYKVVPSPVRFSATPASLRRPAPLIGQHGHEVLAEAGLTEPEIDALVAGGVLHLMAGVEEGAGGASREGASLGQNWDHGQVRDERQGMERAPGS
jgi:crotonobetainyl-CoA:carnitine CoA-transferase CaiB-like acyl-CoA transferase